MTVLKIVESTQRAHRVNGLQFLPTLTHLMVLILYLAVKSMHIILNGISSGSFLYYEEKSYNEISYLSTILSSVS